MQICTSTQTDNHASIPPLSFYRPDALPAAQPTALKHWRLVNSSEHVQNCKLMVQTELTTPVWSSSITAMWNLRAFIIMSWTFKTYFIFQQKILVFNVFCFYLCEKNAYFSAFYFRFECLEKLRSQYKVQTEIFRTIKQQLECPHSRSQQLHSSPYDREL